MMMNKDTILCLSLAANPSNFGTRFHNFLYQALGLNYLYKAFAPADLSQALQGVRGLPVRGCAISMPYKEDAIQWVDELDASVQAIQSVNTIVNTDGILKAYNTDYIAIQKIIERHNISSKSRFAVRGNGGMAKAVLFALKQKGFENGVVVAKNRVKGIALAKTLGYEWKEAISAASFDLLINATPIGMAGSDVAHELAFDEDSIRQAQIVFDVVALPEETPLIQKARELHKATISGAEVFSLQALEQFYLYTGVYPDQHLFQKAAEFSRQETAKIQIECLYKS